MKDGTFQVKHLFILSTIVPHISNVKRISIGRQQRLTYYVYKFSGCCKTFKFKL